MTQSIAWMVYDSGLSAFNLFTEDVVLSGFKLLDLKLLQHYVDEKVVLIDFRFPEGQNITLHNLRAILHRVLSWTEFIFGFACS